MKGKDAELKLPDKNSEKAYCIVEVNDNGIGFSQEDAERILMFLQGYMVMLNTEVLV